MNLTDYLTMIQREFGESENQFADRAKVHRYSLLRIRDGKGCNTRTATRIITASGGLVQLADLVPDDERQAAK